VAALTGLDPALVRKRAGRIDNGTFQRELHGTRGLVASAYDPAVTAFDPYPTSSNSRYSDPVLDGMTAPMTSAMVDFYHRVLTWKVDRPYRLLEREVSSGWDWGRGRTAPEAVDDLRNFLAGDAAARVLVAHGASDLVTPYFANKMLLDQLPAYGAADRVKLSVYAGGHMFYDRDGSRRALRADAQALYGAAVQRD
jgi:carboxypeptidase C (cathepsin A)